MESLLVNLFQTQTNNNNFIHISTGSPFNAITSATSSMTTTSTYVGNNNCFVMASLSLQLCASNRVKSEWRAAVKAKHGVTPVNLLAIDLFDGNHASSISISKDHDENDDNGDTGVTREPNSNSSGSGNGNASGASNTSRKTSMSRSKSLFNEIQC